MGGGMVCVCVGGGAVHMEMKPVMEGEVLAGEENGVLDDLGVAGWLMGGGGKLSKQSTSLAFISNLSSAAVPPRCERREMQMFACTPHTYKHKQFGSSTEEQERNVYHSNKVTERCVHVSV